MRWTALPPNTPNQFWQTDFTCLKDTGWGWFCVFPILDGFSR